MVGDMAEIVAVFAGILFFWWGGKAGMVARDEGRAGARYCRRCCRNVAGMLPELLPELLPEMLPEVARWEVVALEQSCGFAGFAGFAGVSEW